MSTDGEHERSGQRGVDQSQQIRLAFRNDSNKPFRQSYRKLGVFGIGVIVPAFAVEQDIRHGRSTKVRS